MTAAQWDAEAWTVRWYGAFDGDALVGVMGLERWGPVALLRHAYVLPAYQRQGAPGTAALAPPLRLRPPLRPGQDHRPPV